LSLAIVAPDALGVPEVDGAEPPRSLVKTLVPAGSDVPSWANAIWADVSVRRRATASVSNARDRPPRGSGVIHSVCARFPNGVIRRLAHVAFRE
jgi:hypothetical protein